ncbi:MAG: hypothetical protein SF172_07270 [Burkholderiales bacterium]|nr:hypothetical protein [Burkholderiales bacterium]
MVDAYFWFPSEKYQDFSPINEQDGAKLSYWDSLTGTPLPHLSRWQPPRLVPYFPGESNARKLKPIGDFASSRNPYLISQNAANVLGDLFERHGSLYPVILEGASQAYFMFVCHTIVNCLDREKSRIKWSPIDPNDVAVVLEPAFHAKALGDNVIFAVPEVPHCYYVTNAFKERVKKAKLKGLKLSRSWFDSKPWYS